nr:LysR substrate-binding domain-containing protein [Burkholderia sp. KCJ3K979]
MLARVPRCAPGRRAGRAPARAAAAARQPALGLESPAATRGVTFNSYALVIHAALLGEGVALGWAPLVDELVAAGQLVKLVDAPVVTSRGYFLVRPPQRPEPDATHVFRRWLLDACAAA